jgi:flagellar M-ring protein FliF
LVNSEALSQSVRDLPGVWQALGRTRQIIAGGVVAAVAIAIVAGLLFLQRPAQVALYTGLADQDAASIVAKLRELKVPYTIADGGGTINVPQAQAADLRLQLASAGLPSGSGVGIAGYELFDKNQLGITDFAQNLNRQRALEGELARTIRRLSAIQDARVHLVIPEQSLFTSQQKDTTASVVIQLKPGAKLSDEQVASIKFLVTKAVEGLKAENVAVVDTNGNTLGKLDSPETARDKEANVRLQVQHQRESELEKKLQDLLAPVVGANHAIVRASVTLDWDQVQSKSTTFGTPVPRSVQDNRESYSGTGAADVAALGVPGTQSNIPSYQGAPGSQNNSYNSSKVTTNNELPTQEQNIVRALGDVKNVGIAVMVDQAIMGADPAAQQAKVDQITKIVSAAAAINPSRGDQVSVESMPFDNATTVQLKAQQEQQRKMEWIDLGLKVFGVVLALAGMFALFRFLVGSVKPKPPLLAAAEPVSLPGGAAALLPPTQFQDQVLALAEQLGRDPGDLVNPAQMAQRRAAEQVVAAEAERERAEAEARRRDHIRESVAKMALQKPEALAEVLATWLEQEKAPASNRAVTKAKA